MITVNGGYAFTKIDREQTYSTTTALKTQGFRTDVLYEFIPEGQPVAYGFLVGYAGLYANESFSSYPNQKAEYRIYTIPVAFAPKVFFGSGRVKAFIKVDIGMQFSGIKRTGIPIEIKANDFGFLLGAGGGGMVNLTDKLFLTLEYNIDWITNGYYQDGWLNSALLGVGMKF
jgi:hypothetical protein